MFHYKIDDGVELRQINYDQAEALFNLVDKNRDHLRAWLPWVDMTKTAEDTKDFFKTCLQQQVNDDGFQTSIWVDGKAAGMIGFHRVTFAKEVTLGYWLGAEFTGRGVITKATKILVDYAFDHMGMNRVVIQAGTGNKASRAIPEKLNFTHEGTARQSFLLRKEFLDMEQYAMLKKDWVESKP